jgi:hypothetical protein
VFTCGSLALTHAAQWTAAADDDDTDEPACPVNKNALFFWCASCAAARCPICALTLLRSSHRRSPRCRPKSLRQSRHWVAPCFQSSTGAPPE